MLSTDTLSTGWAGRCLKRTAVLPDSLPGHRRKSSVSCQNCAARNPGAPWTRRLEKMIYHSFSSLLLPSCLLYHYHRLCRDIRFIAVTRLGFTEEEFSFIRFFFFFFTRKIQRDMGCDKPSNIFFVLLGFRRLEGWQVFLRSPGLGNMCVL